MEAKYEILNHLFDTIPSEVSQFRYGSLKKIEENATLLANVQAKTKTITTFEALEKENVAFKAFYFQVKAREYISDFFQLRDTMVDIQKRLKDQIQAAGSQKPSASDLNDAGKALDFWLFGFLYRTDTATNSY